MKIYSKFTDYYDSVLGLAGVDSTITYVRKTTELTDDNQFDVFTKLLPNNTRNLTMQLTSHDNVTNPKFSCRNPDLNWMLLLFCGRSIPIIDFHYKDYEYGFNEFHIPCISSEKVLDTLLTYGQTELHSNITTPQRWGYHHKNHITKWFEKFKNLSNCDELHRHVDSPLIMVHPNRIEINPCLKQYNLASVIDPYTTYQEISMYISNQLAHEKMIPVIIEDKYKIQSKGFDDKSFKTRSNTKKPRRKNKK